MRIITPKDMAVDMDEPERADSLAIDRLLPWAARRVSTAGCSIRAKMR